MEYLNKVLGIQTKYENVIINDLPNFIISRYKLQLVTLDDQKVIFLYPKEELEQVKSLKTHISRITKEYSFPVILILERITSRQKEYLIRDRIPFIVEGKQIYLPFMATYLQEKCDAELMTTNKILPSTQMLLLYFIYHGTKDLLTSLAAKELNLTPTSISRASKQLESLNILNVKKIGVQKILYYDGNTKKLFENAQSFLENPIKRTVYIPKSYLTDDLLESNLTALSKYSMINESGIKYYATNSISKWKDVMTANLMDQNSQIGIELWKYDPKILSKNRVVDKLSLALSFKDEDDERIEGAVEEMLENLWRKINGKWN